MSQTTFFSSSTKTCSVEGCDRKHRAKGLCSVHYARRYRTGSVQSAHRRGCVIDGCKRKHKAKGYCTGHYRKLRLYGDPLETKHRETCSLCAGKHYARGFCYDHWNVWRAIQTAEEPSPERLPIDPLKPHLEQWVASKGDVAVGAELDLSHGHIHHLLNRNKSVDLDTADKICIALGLPFDALFNRAQGVAS